MRTIHCETRRIGKCFGRVVYANAEAHVFDVNLLPSPYLFQGRAWFEGGEPFVDLRHEKIPAVSAPFEQTLERARVLAEEWFAVVANEIMRRAHPSSRSDVGAAS